MLARHRLRAAANTVNLATPAGLALAAAASGSVRRGRDGLWIAHGYRLVVPRAPAFTLGNVVLLRMPLPQAGADPVGSIPVRLLRHEERHATQYALCGGVLMPAAYLVAAGWSWLRTGDWGSRNVFERWAGLSDGGYRERPVRPLAAARADLRRLAGRGRSG